MSPEETGDHLRVSYDNKIHTGTKLERWKSSVSGRLVSWPQIKKVKVFKCCLLLFYASMNHFSIELWHAMESEFYKRWLVTTSSVAGPRRSSKALPKVKLTPKKKSWSLFSALLPIWSTIAFWIPAVKPLHLRNILSKSMRYIENCNACSRHSSTDRTQFFSMTTPDCTSILQKLSKLGYKVLPCPPYSLDLLPTNYHFFKHLDNFFSRKMLPQPAGGRKCFPRVHWIPKCRFLCYRNKQTYFLLAKMCWL